MDTNISYQKKKNTIVSSFKKIKKQNIQIGLSKKTSNLFRDKKRPQVKINFKNLNKVIKIDQKKLTADIEAATTYEDIVNQTLKYNLMPTVVPQLATITIGGAVTGVGIEASSFKYGLVHETVLELDILLPEGKVITATPHNKYKDLFYGIVNSYGTLGYILRVKVKLIKTKPYVKTQYVRFENSDEYFHAIQEISKISRFNSKKVDFMDGMITEKSKYLMLGTFVKEAPYTSNYKYLNIFYHSIIKRKEDCLTTRDFIWRWDPDWFWCSKNFGLQNRFLRIIAGKFLLNSRSYWKMMDFEKKYKITEKLPGDKKEKETIIQDVQIPVRTAPKFLDFFLKNITIRPVWICPTKTFAKKILFPFYPLDPKTLHINFGFWDTVDAKKGKPHYYNRLVEKMVEKLNGKKSLYSESFYPEKEFWKIHDLKHYDFLKSKYDPQKRLKNLFEKVVNKN